MFANKEEALNVITSRFPRPDYALQSHRMMSGCYLFQITRADETAISSLSEQRSINEVVELLRVGDCTAHASRGLKDSSVTFAIHVEKPSLPAPRSAFAVFEAAVILLDPYIRVGESVTDFVRDPNTGITTFTLIADVPRSDVELQARSLEAYLVNHGVESASVMIAEIRRRPPYTRYDQTRITIAMATNELNVVKFNRAAADLESA